MDGRRIHIYTRGAAEGVNLPYYTSHVHVQCVYTYVSYVRMYMYMCTYMCTHVYTHMCGVGVREAADKCDDTTPKDRSLCFDIEG